MKSQGPSGGERWWKAGTLVIALVVLIGQPCGRQTTLDTAAAGPVRDLAEVLEPGGSGGGPCAGDPAAMNLRCAEGLPGAEDLNLAACLSVLDHWAAHVRAETERHLYRFRANPRAFEHSEGYFRMLIMAVVVAEDFGVRYNRARMGNPAAASVEDGFFADSRDVFLHGLLGPRRMGTCSSMPILYLALGRRLGYPLKLVTTQAHLFLRWESDQERFNLEATGRGMNRYDDEHYKQWPFRLTAQEIAENGYLKSLDAAEEWAVFLSIRSQCLKEAGRSAEAQAALAEAIRLAPKVKLYRLLLAESPSSTSVVADAGRLSPMPGSELGTWNAELASSLLTSAPTASERGSEAAAKPVPAQPAALAAEARAELDRMLWQLDAGRAAGIGLGLDPNPRLQLR